MACVINIRIHLFCEADEVDDKEGISKVCEDEDDEDPENRYVEEDDEKSQKLETKGANHQSHSNTK